MFPVNHVYTTAMPRSFSLEFSPTDVAKWMKIQYNLPEHDCKKLMGKCDYITQDSNKLFS